MLIGGVFSALRTNSSKRLSLSSLRGVAMTDSPNLSTVDPSVERASDVYRALMVEIKVRLLVIQDIVDDLRADPEQKRGYIKAECAFLQLRFVCELMAHAAIAAHQPFGKVEELLDSWHARLAYEQLIKLHKDCFPRPVGSVQETAPGRKHIDFQKGLPTLRGLLGCYLRCGKLLHRGIVRHAFDGTQKLYDIEWLDEWAVRIGELLVHHTALIPEEGIVFITHLYGGPDDQVSVQIGVADGPAVVVEP